MQFFVNSLYLLPCFICLVWLVIYYFRVKVTTQRMMMVLQVLAVFYFATYAVYISPSTDYALMARLDTLNVPVALFMVAVDLVYLWTHQNRRLLESRRHLLLYAPALILSSINTILVYLVGFDDIARFEQALDTYGSYPPGFDNPNILLYYQFNAHLLNYVLFAFVLFITYWCIRMARRQGYLFGDVFRFFFRANVSTPLRVVCYLNVLVLWLLVPMVPLGDLGRTYLVNHPALGCTLALLLSITLFCLCYVEYMIDLPRFSLASLANVNLHGAIHSTEDPVAPSSSSAPSASPSSPSAAAPSASPSSPSAAPSLSSKPFDGLAPASPSASAPASAPDGLAPASASAPAPPSDDPLDDDPDPVPATQVRYDERVRLESALRHALDEERIYCEPDLSIVKLSARLGTNRTTLSVVIAQTFAMNFRQLLAQYRVEAAKQYMRENPLAKQEEVAVACGFITAQSFNQKFKELVGDAPRMWMVKQSTGS